MDIDFKKMGTWDIERFADLLKFCVKEGYDLEHADGGFNPNSGNVWIWSECEQSTAFCDMGGNCKFLFTCPECGTEFESDDKNFFKIENPITEKECCLEYGKDMILNDVEQEDAK